MKTNQSMKIPQQKKFAQRFIPNRASSNLLSFQKLQQDRSLLSYQSGSDQQTALYSALLKDQLFKPDSQTNKIFHYSNQTPGKQNEPFVAFAQDDLYSPLKSQRKIPKTPYKVLDAPALQDDFYLNLVDWSNLNVLSVGLGSSVYLWNANNSKVNKLCDLGFNDSVTSLSWSQSGNHISVGTSQGSILLWDVQTNKLLRSFSGHNGRVGTMAWNGRLLTTGSRDRQILHRDVRCPDDFVTRLYSHKQEICGLKWSFDQQQLASGGNDNKLMIWNLHSCSPVSKFQEHVAAVKALAWSPHQHGLLASGGGTADRTIRFWNTLSSEHIQCVDTGSQVCNLMFSKTSKELVSTHGYSLNQIILWKYPGAVNVATLTGHTYRVLYLAMSPDGQVVVTGAGDQTLRFWEIFPSSKNDGEANKRNSLFPSVFDLR